MTFWDKIAGFYDIAESLNPMAYKAMLNGVKSIVPEGAKVLDCAAGTGALSLAAAEKAEHVLCTDMSLPMLDRARKKSEKAGFANIDFAERDILSLADEDGTYDVAMAGNVLHLLENPEKAVRELCRVTKHGGRVILPTFMAKGNNLLIKIYTLMGYRAFAEYTAESYEKMLKGCGCGRVKVTEIKGTIPVAFGVIKTNPQ
ncbi:MAG: methyltransferase domain-containing protein [Ruminococcus sp.]|nr:methyltransferase domain-containing protein [Ruminococcus sp.]MCM1380463.1 methyltransferase domain-containing protein [Muribaculaceae bacterium]MCM1479062.1 methyltransferase domain-containing protein [Muribaculaceae bacterium]